MGLPAGNRIPKDNNRSTLLGGISYLNPNVAVPATFDPSTGAQLVNVVSGTVNAVGIDPVGQSGVAYDTILYTNTSTTVDTYVYKTGGAVGTTTATITITYTDTTKTQMSSTVRT